MHQVAPEPLSALIGGRGRARDLRALLGYVRRSLIIGQGTLLPLAAHRFHRIHHRLLLLFLWRGLRIPIQLLNHDLARVGGLVLLMGRYVLTHFVFGCIGLRAAGSSLRSWRVIITVHCTLLLRTLLPFLRYNLTCRREVHRVAVLTGSYSMSFVVAVLCRGHRNIDGLSSARGMSLIEFLLRRLWLLLLRSGFERLADLSNWCWDLGRLVENLAVLQQDVRWYS